MIRDVTTIWATERTREGLYIVRCTKEGWTDRVRVGAGAINDGRGGITLRLTGHAKPWANAPEWETHKLQPFADVVKAWSLDGWVGEQIADGERCLYRALLVRFPKHRGTQRDKSTFVVPVGEDLSEAIDDVDADLRRLEQVYAAPARVVDVPHLVTAKKGKPRIPRIHRISPVRDRS